MSKGVLRLESTHATSKQPKGAAGPAEPVNATAGRQVVPARLPAWSVAGGEPLTALLADSHLAPATPNDDEHGASARQQRRSLVEPAGTAGITAAATAVSNTGTNAESEADMAMRPPEKSKRQATTPDGVPPDEPPAERAARSGLGLDDTVRAAMEARFGEDFGDVRIHVDAPSATLAQRLHVPAFTLGQDIFFASRQYQPATRAGRHLIAHELTHTIHQRGNGVTSAGSAPRQAGGSDALEAEADHVADTVLAGGVVRVNGRAPAGSVQGKVLNDVVPSEKVNVSWGGDPAWGGDTFEITFDSRVSEPTTELHYLVFKIRYTGPLSIRGYPLLGQSPIQDKSFAIEESVFEMQPRKFNARIVEYDPGSIVRVAEPNSVLVDVYGDSKKILKLVDVYTPNLKQHAFSVHDSGGKGQNYTVWIEGTPSATPATPATPGGTVTPSTKPATPAVTPAGPGTPPPGVVLAEQAPLSTSTLLGVALARLEEVKLKAPQIQPLIDEVKRELAAPTSTDEPALRRRAERLNTMVSTTQAVFPALAALENKDSYLPAIADEIVKRVATIKGMYAAALLFSYSDRDPKDELLARAETAMREFPDWLAGLYLGPDGIEKTLTQVQPLQDDILRLRIETRRSNTTRAADKLVWLDLRRPQTIAQALRESLDFTRQRRAGKRPDATAALDRLTADTQAVLAIMTAIALYDQFLYWEDKLDGSIVDWIYDPKLKLARTYRQQLDTVLAQFEKYDVSPPDPKQWQVNRELIVKGMQQLSTLVSSAEFGEAVKAIQERLKTIATINLIGTIVLITVAAALTAGAAGAAVGGALEGLGATAGVVRTGVFVAETLAFTVASRAGQTVAFGQAEGSFLGDLAWNALMLGAVKGAASGFSRVFKLVADPKVYKVAFRVGTTAAATITLQAFAEAQHAVKTGTAMTGEERYRSVLQNVILATALEAGRFITKPIEQRVEAIIGGKLKTMFGDRLKLIEADRLALLDQLQKLERGKATPAEIETLLKAIQDIWAKELKLLSDGVQRKAFSQAEAEQAMSGYQGQIARMELRLSQVGVDAPLGTGTPSFRPLRPGLVAFSPAAREILEAFYKQAGGEVKQSVIPDMLEGRLPNGELTFFVQEGTVPKQAPRAEQVVGARDTARREAEADPVAAEGLKRLETEFGFGQRSVDEVLASVAPENVGALLRALADSRFGKNSLEFYSGLAGQPQAIAFGRRFGGDVLTNMWRRYRWTPEFIDALGRASDKLDATTGDARASLLESLRTETNRTKMDALLGKAPPPKPPPPIKATKASMGVDRAHPSWKVLRAEAEAFATAHKEQLTSEQLDLRADLEQVVDAARRGGFAKLGRVEKIRILDRFDELAAKSGMLQTWINNRRGAVSEHLFNPGMGQRKPIYKAGVEVSWAEREGGTIPDYSISGGTFTEWVNQKSDIIDSGNKRGDGAFESGVDRARTYRTKADKEAGNLPAGDKYSIEFVRDPGPVTRQRMLEVLFGPGSPIYRVKFGDTWYTKP